MTGDFDGWKKTEKLEKTAAGHFEKTVVIPSSDTRHEYKVGLYCLRSSGGGIRSLAGTFTSFDAD